MTPFDAAESHLLFDARQRHAFIGWCHEQHVNELYLEMNGLPGCDRRGNASTAAALLTIFEELDAASIDIQMFVGDVLGSGCPSHAGCEILDCTRASLGFARQLRNRSITHLGPPRSKTDDGGVRNPPPRPFASWSIWNLPPGANARMVPASALKADDNFAREGAPLACQPNAEQPMLPVFHFIGNVSKNASGHIALEQINDVSGITYHEGLWHVWHQCCQDHWDHAISRDLRTWQRLPPPIQPLTTKTWDGSVTMLPASDGGPAILYDAQDGKLGSRGGRRGRAGSGDRPILGVARLADPDDKYLMTWRRDQHNPVKFAGAPLAFPGQVWIPDEGGRAILHCPALFSNHCIGRPDGMAARESAE
jgi:hypothetical protein